MHDVKRINDTPKTPKSGIRGTVIARLDQIGRTFHGNIRCFKDSDKADLLIKFTPHNAAFPAVLFSKVENRKHSFHLKKLKTTCRVKTHSFLISRLAMRARRLARAIHSHQITSEELLLVARSIPKTKRK
jgi:hypothetical protein